MPKEKLVGKTRLAEERSLAEIKEENHLWKKGQQLRRTIRMLHEVVQGQKKGVKTQLEFKAMVYW